MIESFKPPEGNLKLWVAVVAYAAGIAVGARILPDYDFPVMAGFSGIVVLTTTLFCLVWAAKQSNPKYGVAYGLLVAAFLVAGLIAGASTSPAATSVPGAGPAETSVPGAASPANTTNQTGDAIKNTEAPKSNQIAVNTQKVSGYDTEKIPLIKAVRQHIKATINETLPERYRGLMMGVILGETEDIPQDMTADFKTTGLSHILAVSGLNITILIMAFGYVVNAATVNMDRSGRYFAFAITVCAVVFYMFLTKLQPSVVRAGVMGIAALAAILASKPGNPFPALAAAAMAILVVDPTALFNIGFQLSFAATIAILLFTPLLEASFKAGHGSLKAAASLTLAAQLGVAPLLVVYFGQLSLISIAANVVVGSAIAPATVLGIVIAVSGMISIGLARIVAMLAEPCLAYISEAASYFAGWPYASISLPPVSVWHVAAYYLVLGLFYLALVKYNQWQSVRATVNDFPNRRFARTATAALLLAALVIGLFGCQAARSRPPNSLRVVFIDVGQGDATLIQAEDGASILIDGGPEPNSAINVLRDYGVKSIDLLIVTHPHSDHATGIESVVNGYLVKRAIMPPKSSSTGRAGQIISALKRNSVSETVAEQGQSYKIGEYLKVNILSPDEATLSATSGGESADANNRAIVAKIQYKKVTMMFTGDIESETEEAMVGDGEANHADVLKVPHHGSKNGANVQFLKAICPEVAVISVGENNPFHHPAPSTISKLKQAGALVYRTDKNGSVIIESDGSSIHVSTSK